MRQLVECRAMIVPRPILPFFVLFALSVLPNPAFCAGPQSGPQIYALKSENAGHVVMLSNWPEGAVFAQFEDPRNEAVQHFRPDQPVWIYCDGRVESNMIRSIDTSRDVMTITTVTLLADPKCEPPVLLSNKPIPAQNWKTRRILAADAPALAQRLKAAVDFFEITNRDNETFFLVFDPSIPAIYDTGGYRFLDVNAEERLRLSHAPLVPLIDLDDDGFPEVFFPSSDGQEAWLWRIYPTLNTDLELGRSSINVESILR